MTIVHRLKFRTDLSTVKRKLTLTATCITCSLFCLLLLASAQVLGSDDFFDDAPTQNNKSSSSFSDFAEDSGKKEKKNFGESQIDSIEINRLRKKHNDKMRQLRKENRELSEDCECALDGLQCFALLRAESWPDNITAKEKKRIRENRAKRDRKRREYLNSIKPQCLKWTRGESSLVDIEQRIAPYKQEMQEAEAYYKEEARIREYKEQGNTQAISDIYEQREQQNTKVLERNRAKIEKIKQDQQLACQKLWAQGYPSCDCMGVEGEPEWSKQAKTCGK